jgi:DAACS family dicarboxylate/amino acid:cation (Na+ or H+) symporter
MIDDLVPRSLGEVRAKNNLAQMVLLALVIGIALAKVRNVQRARGQHTYQVAVDWAVVAFDVLLRVVLWVVALVPAAVFGVVATTIARQGFAVVQSLGWFIVVVLLGLSLQVVWYMAAMGGIARLRPSRFVRAVPDVVAATFSSASTAAAMPFTLDALTRKLGISRASSQLAACVGTNFNNDGTALYQASAVLFFAQALGADLSLGQQALVVASTVVASFGAGGIPSGSFVVMPLIFGAAGLPVDKLPVLLTIDWLLDRFRTTSNVLGDMQVAVLLDRPGIAGEGPPAPPGTVLPGIGTRARVGAMPGGPAPP